MVGHLNILYLAVHCVLVSARDMYVPLSKLYCTYHVTDSTRTAVGLFATAGPSAWNSLTDPVRNPNVARY